MKIAMLLLAALLQDADVQEKDYDLDRDAVVKVSNVAGRLQIRAWDKDHAAVKITKKGKNHDKVTVRVDASDKKLVIETEYPEGWWKDNDWKDPVKVDIEISLPSTLKSIELSSVSGRIDLDGTRTGRSRLNTVSGRIQIKGTRGDLAVNTVSGKILIRETTGDKAEITSSTGSVDGSARLKELKLNVVTGKVKLDVTPSEAGFQIRASTVTGAIQLGLPDSAGAALSATTLNGKIHCDFELKDQNDKEDMIGRTIKGSFGSGRGRVQLASTTGKLSITRMK